MPRAITPDGVGIHWEERGSGPPVVLVSYWNLHPSVFGPITRELEGDHRVIRYDDRGCGESEAVGPHDMETAAVDLEAVCEAAGDGPAVAIALVDGTNRAVRVAARRPDLIEHVIGVGSGPVGRNAFADQDALISSNTVVGAFMQMLDTDYRGAVRSMLESANSGMSPDEVRERVNLQVEYTPREVASSLVTAWAEDPDAAEIALTIGNRLTILNGDSVGGGWFPDAARMATVFRETFPEANVESIEQGIVTAPELTAGFVRAATRTHSAR